MLACGFAGCTVFPTTHDEMSFKYVADGGEDDFDQMLEITNDGLNAVAPRLEITPLDAAGHPVSGVAVITAYGSDRGRMVVPSFMTGYDVLRFEGDRAHEVRDVRVRVEDLEQVSYPDFDDYVEVQRFDDDVAVDLDKTFDAVELSNTNDEAMTVGVALFAWQEEPRSDLQQFAWVIALDDVYTVPAGGRKRVPLPEGLADELVVDAFTYPALGDSHAEDPVTDVGEWRVRAGRQREP